MPAVSRLQGTNRTYREEVLNCYVFETLDEVRHMTDEWITRYNEFRTHESRQSHLSTVLDGKIPIILYFRVVRKSEGVTPRAYLMAKSP